MCDILSGIHIKYVIILLNNFFAMSIKSIDLMLHQRAIFCICVFKFLFYIIYNKQKIWKRFIFFFIQQNNLDGKNSMVF